MGDDIQGGALKRVQRFQVRRPILFSVGTALPAAIVFALFLQPLTDAVRAIIMDLVRNTSSALDDTTYAMAAHNPTSILLTRLFFLVTSFAAIGVWVVYMWAHSISERAKKLKNTLENIRAPDNKIVDEVKLNIDVDKVAQKSRLAKWLALVLFVGVVLNFGYAYLQLSTALALEDGYEERLEIIRPVLEPKMQVQLAAEWNAIRSAANYRRLMAKFETLAAEKGVALPASDIAPSLAKPTEPR